MPASESCAPIPRRLSSLPFSRSTSLFPLKLCAHTDTLFPLIQDPVLEGELFGSWRKLPVPSPLLPRPLPLPFVSFLLDPPLLPLSHLLNLELEPEEEFWKEDFVGWEVGLLGTTEPVRRKRRIGRIEGRQAETMAMEGSITVQRKPEAKDQVGSVVWRFRKVTKRIVEATVTLQYDC